MKSYALAFAAAALFIIAAILSFVDGSSVRGVVSIIGALSFLLAGIHWRRTGRKDNQNKP